jgi:hypothetical protein
MLAACYYAGDKYFVRVTRLNKMRPLMACIAFIASLLVCGIVSSFVSVDTNSVHANQPDYHFVPFAGDAFGA